MTFGRLLDEEDRAEADGAARSFGVKAARPDVVGRLLSALSAWSASMTRCLGHAHAAAMATSGWWLRVWRHHHGRQNLLSFPLQLT